MYFLYLARTSSHMERISSKNSGINFKFNSNCIPLKHFTIPELNCFNLVINRIDGTFGKTCYYGSIKKFMGRDLENEAYLGK